MAIGSLISLRAGKLRSIGALISKAFSLPGLVELSSRMASVHALPGPYINVPSMYGVISFNCKTMTETGHMRIPPCVLFFRQKKSAFETSCLLLRANWPLENNGS